MSYQRGGFRHAIIQPVDSFSGSADEMIVARHGKPGALHLLLHQISGVKTRYRNVPAAWVTLAEQGRSISGECRRQHEFVTKTEPPVAEQTFTGKIVRRCHPVPAIHDRM